MKKENCPNEEIVQSKISIQMMFLCFISVCCCFFLGWGLYEVVGSYATEKIYDDWWLDFFLPVLFVAAICLLFLITLLYTIVCFKYRVVISKSLRTMIYFSLWHSKGVTLKLDDYTGYYAQTKTTHGTVDGQFLRLSQEVCYLVDSQKRSRQIISSIAYRNYKQMKKALGLPQIMKTPVKNIQKSGCLLENIIDTDK